MLFRRTYRCDYTLTYSCKYGRFTGTAVLDDGTPVDIKDFPGFAEKVENKW